MDGVFQRLLLLQKKKYAAIKVIDGTSTSTEVKGLDMKRREYCALSKNVSQYVLLVVYYDSWLTVFEVRPGADFVRRSNRDSSRANP